MRAANPKKLRALRRTSEVAYVNPMSRFGYGSAVRGFACATVKLGC